MQYEDLARQFWLDGFLVVDDFFDAATMDDLDERIRGHFGKDPAFGHTEAFLEAAKTEVIPWFPQQDGPSAFDQLDEHAGLQALTRAILGAGWRRDYCMVMYSRKGTSGQAWHQDCPPDDPRRHNLNRLVYTRDITDDVGGQTLVVPGSHRQGELPVGDPAGEFPGQVTLRPRSGTLVMLHGHAWHRVLPVTGDYRYSTNYRAAPKGTPDGITDVCVYRNMRYRFSTESVVEERV